MENASVFQIMRLSSLEFSALSNLYARLSNFRGLGAPPQPPTHSTIQRSTSPVAVKDLVGRPSCVQVVDLSVVGKRIYLDSSRSLVLSVPLVNIRCELVSPAEA